MFCLTGSRADWHGACTVLADGGRVGVVEPEPHRDAEALRCKSAVDPIEIRVAVELEDLLGDRAGIFRIQIDRAGLERGENDAGVAQTGSMLDRCLALHRLA